MASIMRSLLLFSASLAACNAQLQYFAAPEPTLLSSTSPMGDGNALKLTPDGSLLIATSSNGAISAFDPSTGASAWTHTPATNPEPTLSRLSCTSGIVFSNNPAIGGDYLVYAVTDGLAEADPSAWYVSVRD